MKHHYCQSFVKSNRTYHRMSCHYRTSVLVPIQNLHLIPADSLLLLPQSMRYKLLHNLPAMDIWQLEATPFTDNLDLEKVWEVLLKKRCTFPVNALSKLPGRSSRDRYFAAVWKTLLSTLNITDEKFSRLLFQVPNPLDLK